MFEVVAKLTPMFMLSCVTIWNTMSYFCKIKKKTGKKCNGGVISAIMPPKIKQTHITTSK